MVQAQRRTPLQMQQTDFNITNIIGGYLDKALGKLSEEEYDEMMEQIRGFMDYEWMRDTEVHFGNRMIRLRK